MAKVKGREHFWFKFDIDAYEDSTDHLSALEDGTYNRLIRHYYKTYKPIPLDEQQIVRIARAHSAEEIAAVSRILREFFEQLEDGWHNKRCDREILEAKKISRLRSKSAHQRWDDKPDANAHAKAYPSSHANGKQLDTQLQLQKHKELEPKAKARCAFELPPWVPQEAWNHYTEMRNRIRKPMTDQAKKWAVKLLESLRKRGHEPRAVLEQSVFNSWQGLFEVKGDGTHQHSVKQSRAREVANTNAAAFAAVMGGSAMDIGPISHQGADDRRSGIVAGEVKRLPE